MKIKNYLQFLNDQVIPEGLPERDPNEIVGFRLSSKFETTLKPLRSEYKVADLYLKLKEGVERKYLSKDPPDYLDIDDEGNLSFLKSRYFGEGDPWTTSRRIKMKITKALKEFYDETYMNSLIKQTDVEAFINKWNSLLKSKRIHAEEYRGKEMLRAFNYTRELSKNFGYSCANFHQDENEFGKYTEPKLSEFDIYTKNPEQIGVVVAMEDGVIMGRRTVQQGIQVCDTANYNKGEFHTVWGNYYGVGGGGGKYDNIITTYIIKKWPDAKGMRSNALCVSLETRFTYYCPFDSMYVCFEHNLMTDNYSYLPLPYRTYKWVGCYHAICPKELVKQRIEEENGFMPDVNVKRFSDYVDPKLPYIRNLTDKEIEKLCEYFPHYTWAKGIDQTKRLIVGKPVLQDMKEENFT